jgi:hypothetical protein
MFMRIATWVAQNVGVAHNLPKQNRGIASNLSKLLCSDQRRFPPDRRVAGEGDDRQWRHPPETSEIFLFGQDVSGVAKNLFLLCYLQTAGGDDYMRDEGSQCRNPSNTA